MNYSCHGSFFFLFIIVIIIVVVILITLFFETIKFVTIKVKMEL